MVQMLHDILLREIKALYWSMSRQTRNIDEFEDTGIHWYWDYCSHWPDRYYTLSPEFRRSSRTVSIACAMTGLTLNQCSFWQVPICHTTTHDFKMKLLMRMERGRRSRSARVPAFTIFVRMEGGTNSSRKFTRHVETLPS